MLKKIKEFFIKIFRINNCKYIEAPKEEIITNNIKEESDNFKSKIIVENEEDRRILKLQQDFKAGLIKEEDLPEEDFDLLNALYLSQIEKVKQSIEEYKNKIIVIKSKLEQNN